MSSTSSAPDTPARDRLPFPPSAQRSPSGKRLAPASGSTASLPPNATLTPTQVINLDSLLLTHADAPSPPMAALQQVLSERNAFAAQNAQLWRLIEKQRSGYNQILKELERVRSERDVYKNRSNAMVTNDKDKKRDGEKQRRPSNPVRPSDPSSSLSHSRADQSTSSGPHQAIPRTSQDSHIPSSRSTPPPPPHSTLGNSLASALTGSMNSSDITPLGPSSSSEPTINAKLPPFSFPMRSESLPVMPTSMPSSPLQPPYDMYPAQPPEPSQLAQSSRMAAGHAQEPPLLLHGGITIPSSVTHSSAGQATAVASVSTAKPTDDAPPSYLYSEPGDSNPSAPALLIPTTGERHTSSRDSRISLPDEAKQYIANMQQSPLTDAESSKFTPSQSRTSEAQDLSAISTPQPPLSDRLYPQRRTFASLDPPAVQATTYQTWEKKPNVDPSRPANFTHSMVNPEMMVLRDGQQSTSFKHDQRAGTRAEHDEFLDLDDDDQGVEDLEDEEVVRRPSPTKRAAVEDFPMPPSNPPAAGFSYAQSDTHTDWLPTETTIQMSVDPPGSSYSQSDQSSTTSSRALPAAFRALPLLASDLPYTQIKVSHSSIRPNDKGKDVSSFIVDVSPGNGKERWKIEKLYSDVLALDARVRASVGRGVGKKIASLPEGKLWRDHAPAKVDQRKAALETYLQTLINLPVKNKDEVIAFFTSDIVRDTQKPVSQVGYKEGYLTKRGKNFGGWKTRFFVLQGPVLEYYESRGGTHLGSIFITGAQIGRQQKTVDKSGGDEEKEYRHAFLIVEAKKGPGGSHPRHVLCAESDAERDEWVEKLVRYVLGSYNEDPGLALGPSPLVTNDHAGSMAPRSSTSSNGPDHNLLGAGNPRRPIARGASRDDVSTSSYLSTNPTGHGSSPTNLFDSSSREPSPIKSAEPSPVDRHAPAFPENLARKVLERGQAGVVDPLPLSSSLPTALSPLDDINRSLAGMRPSSELGQYSDGRHHQVDQKRKDNHGDASFLDTIAPVPRVSIQSADHRAPSPEKAEANAKAKISGPIGGVPIPAGYKFGGKDPLADPSAASATAFERREKAKSRLFWGFGRPNGAEKSQPAFTNRSVFGVSLDESLEVAQIANLPAVVFRCIQYLEAKKADHEEGIYRLSGSSAVIKSLKDRFNSEGDVDLLASDEYWDPHAIAGLLKSFLRELPASILTRDLHLRFLSVIDFVDPQERIKELSQLIAALPIANYSLLRALTAHLILIVQNANINKMTMRNVGIVFSPTLGIPAGVFSLMLGEFNRVFNVDDDVDDELPLEDGTVLDGISDLSRRNSRQYSDAAADQLLGLSGRTLSAPVEDPQSDGDDFSMDESGTETTEGDGTVGSSGTSSPADGASDHHLSPVTPMAPKSKASHTAATRGLNINISERGNRHSRIIGLPTSPRPFGSPQMPPSPLHTPK